MTKRMIGALAAMALAAGIATPVSAADTVRVADAHKGFWDQTLIVFGEEAGIFEKHGIDPEVLWTDGGADAQQAVISGAMDISIGTGALGVISAWAKGAPIEIIAASMTGSSDLFWYVKSGTGVETLADAHGKTMAFSRPGSSTNLVAAKLKAAAGSDVELVPAGGPAAVMTQVMSDQIDIGWSVVPFGLDRIANGEIRVIASGNDAPGVADQTVRYQIVNRDYLKNNRDIVLRFLRAYQETLDWAYSSPEAVQMWAQINEISLEQAQQAIKDTYPKETVALYPIRGTALNVEEAVESGRLDKPLTAAQMDEMLATARALEDELRQE